jgi:hypothetical protein
MKRLLIIAGTVLLTANLSYPKSAVDFGGGVCLFGDAMGFSIQAAFKQNLGGWMSMFGSPMNGGIADDLFVSVGLNTDFVPVEFGITTIEPGISGSYRIKLFEGLSLYPAIGLGVPINIFTLKGVSTTSAGFMLRAGGRAGYQIMESLEAGIGADYRMNLTGVYIGSVGVFAYASLTI